MPDQYPFTVSNNKLEPVLRRIRTAAKPERLTQELLATWGFTASNDRAIPRVLKGLGFLNDNGAPTPDYDRLRDPNEWKHALADRLRITYADLFAIDPNIHNAAENEVKGAISRITGKDEDTVKRYYATFKSLAALAEWTRERKAPPASPPPTPQPTTPEVTAAPASPGPSGHRRTEYHYNIQIHLPVTTDITVYNAIFKSLKENLGF